MSNLDLFNMNNLNVGGGCYFLTQRQSILGEIAEDLKALAREGYNPKEYIETICELHDFNYSDLTHSEIDEILGSVVSTDVFKGKPQLSFFKYLT